MTKPSGRVLEATLLRPRAWLEHELDHATCRVYLDLEELGAVGWADVTSVGRCPPVQTGPGHVVTATFHHQPDKPLVAVRIEGAAEPIECTANHPFWSEDRQEFIEAGELRPRERVLARRGGPVRVAAVEPRDTAPWVHNLEVHGEHVYEVGRDGILVHNEYPEAIALGPWKNLESFWKKLVEGKRLHHLGEPDDLTNALQAELALGPKIFGVSGKTWPADTQEVMKIVKPKTNELINSKTLKSIHFDTTNMNKMSGRLNEGYYAFYELKIILNNPAALKKTTFYVNGVAVKKTKKFIKSLNDIVEKWVE
ncbi:Hint domain-containing protein [Gemmata sp. JC673]|uniref:Hint domain-containing protein n=1 Tax=Gemmata algarum TaxID=2975278 RepID=A0ABU5F8C7_9BACT|nr:Hint domain-containing protein [Gemmata algarum]MDY3563012.1 Hint domain-containing protein [Gemmata algarum]